LTSSGQEEQIKSKGYDEEEKMWQQGAHETGKAKDDEGM